MSETDPIVATARGERVLRSIVGGGVAYFSLFVVVHLVLATTSDGANPWDAVALLLVVAPQWVLIRRRTLDLPPSLTIALGSVLCLAGIAGLLSIAAIRDPDGYDAWFCGAIAFDLLGLTVVGRFGTAWVSMAVLGVECVGWALLGDRPVAVGVGLIVRHIATLAVGTALAVGLRRSNAAAAASHAVQRRRRTEEDVARARAGARRSAVEQVLEHAGPMLRVIADGRRTTPEDRRQMIVLEGTLRDQIRTPRLNAAELRVAVDTARRRGVNVLLLDEAHEAATSARTEAVRWLAARLDATQVGRFVGRLRDSEHGGVRVSAVSDDRGEAEIFD